MKKIKEHFEDEYTERLLGLLEAYLKLKEAGLEERDIITLLKIKG